MRVERARGLERDLLAEIGAVVDGWRITIVAEDATHRNRSSR